MHLLGTLLEEDPENTVLSLDGIGAYDTIRRKAMLQKLRTLPTASAILPFVLLSYGSPSEYFWFDDAGDANLVTQGEGGEQGDPLMPALYSLGQHDALDAVKRQLQPDEELFAFLDDVYVLCTPERARPAFNLLKSELLRHTSVNLHLGKTKV